MNFKDIFLFWLFCQIIFLIATKFVFPNLHWVIIFSPSFGCLILMLALIVGSLVITFGSIKITKKLIDSKEKWEVALKGINNAK
jgi:hypothetical protein